MDKMDHNAHSVYLMYYHLIMVVKYRRKVIDDPISERAKEIWESIMQVYYMKNLTVKTKQKNLIMKTQRYWELIMQCMEWLCFLKIYRRKMKDTSEKVRSGWQGNKESYPIA